MAQRCQLIAGLVLSTFFSLVAGCTSGEERPGPSGAAGTTGTAGTGSTGTAGTGANGTAGTTGVAGTTGAAGTAPAGTAGTTGAAGTSPDGGTTGAAGSSSPTDGGSGEVGPLPPVTTEGDGDFMIGPQFTIDAANKYVAGTPIGRQFAFKMTSAESTIYPGRNGMAYSRNVWVYVPMQYVAGTPAPLMVVLDGNYACWWGNDVPHAVNTGNNLPGTGNLPRILDNYIAAKKLPKIVVVFIEAGGGDGGNSQRGLEYDTVSGVYADYVEKEVLPKAVSEAQKQLQLNLAFSKDPQARGTLGGSSGGAGAFSMAWWHPELYARVITYSGTFVRQASPEVAMFPHGAWCYHDFDPYDAAMPNGLIVKEPGQKPIRHWLEAGQNDLGSGGGPETYRNFLLANRRMAASYKLKNYHYHFDYAQGGGHLDGGAVAQTLPAAMLYVWRGYPVD